MVGGFDEGNVGALLGLVGERRMWEAGRRHFGYSNNSNNHNNYNGILTN